MNKPTNPNAYRNGQSVTVHLRSGDRPATVTTVYEDGATVGVRYAGRRFTNVVPSAIVSPKLGR
jgi:hypothetical protein